MYHGTPDPEPEPCRGCFAPIHPGTGWCADCERELDGLEPACDHDWEPVVEGDREVDDECLTCGALASDEDPF